MSRYRDYVHKFAPAAVAKEIDANPVSPKLEAKDTDVSILFGDLAGYTRMAEQMERRQLDALINRAFSRFVDEIHHYEGILLEIRGDELFVLFADDDRFKACRERGKCGACNFSGGDQSQRRAVERRPAGDLEHGHTFRGRICRAEGGRGVVGFSLALRCERLRW